MIAVIFEVSPHMHARPEYLIMAARLAPLLAEIDGFISIERFQSLNQPEKILSLSFWRDEEAVQRWRNTEEHRAAQSQGRAAISPIIACASRPSSATMDCWTVSKCRRTAALSTAKPCTLFC